MSQREEDSEKRKIVDNLRRDLVLTCHFGKSGGSNNKCKTTDEKQKCIGMCRNEKCLEMYRNVLKWIEMY